MLSGPVAAICSLGPSAGVVLRDERVRAAAGTGAARRYFDPAESRVLREWMARYLTIRAALHETVWDLRPLALSRVPASPTAQRAAFAIAYAAACALVAMARMLVFDLGDSEPVRRKLDEDGLEFRYPRKTWTRIHRGLTSPRTAWRLLEARAVFNEESGEILAAARDAGGEPLCALLEEFAPALEVSLTDYARARWRYRLHAWRRRQSSAFQQGLFALAEVSGRVIADLRWPWHRDRVRPVVQRRLAALLRPGDVIVSRHDHALSNLFLPGYWPHAALHVGSREDVALRTGGAVDPVSARWEEPRRVLEARKDGVLLRPLDDTLAVDSVAVLRPMIEPALAARAAADALVHEGKGYNFDFDFFTEDRLVCTEVVYRALQGVGGIDIPLVERAGRPTLSAEDLVRLALDRRGFEPVVVYGVGRARRRLRLGEDAADVLRQTMAVSSAS